MVGLSENTMMPQEDSVLEKSDMKETNYSINGGERGERVKVAVRCRPM